MRFLQTQSILVLAVLMGFRPLQAADELSPASLLPETTVGYLEFTRTGTAMSTILDHSVTQKIQSLEVYKQATRAQNYRNFLTGRKFFEIQIGTEWRPAIEALTERGIYLAYDATSQGAVVLVRARDEATMENFRVKILELTRLSTKESDVPEPYRDLPVYKIDNGGAVVVRDWLVLTNKAELGKTVLDRLLDGTAAEVASGALSDSPDFQAAMAVRPADSDAWGFLNLTTLRQAKNVSDMFEQQAENPVAELLIGGIQSTLKNTPFVTGSLRLSQEGARLQFSSPWKQEWIPEARAYYFGLDAKGTAPALPQLPETVLTIAAFRDISDMWLRAGDLFDEQIVDSLAEADSNLSTIFSGRDFGEEILGSLKPEVGFIVTRQNFENVQPTPVIKLPAFALIMTLKDPETMRSDLRRMFQNAIGFFNIVGAQGGNPQLEMDMMKEGDVDMITSQYLPERKNADSLTAPIIYNFSPSVAFRGDRFVLSSTAALGKDLVTAELPADQPELNTSLQLQAESLRSVLTDNREQLISQNMLAEGHSREEAEAAIDLLLELVGQLKGAGFGMALRDNQLVLEFDLVVHAENQ